MRPDSLRLLFAANLRLGEPLRTSLPLTEEAREIILESTFSAWRQIQKIAIEREAALVVLNGNSVVAAQLTVKSELALSEGLHAFSRANISVLIQPGQHDPRTFWESFLSENHLSNSGVALISEHSADHQLVQTNNNHTALQPIDLGQQDHSDVFVHPDTVNREPTPQLSRLSEHIIRILPDDVHSPSELTTVPAQVNLVFSNRSVSWSSHQESERQQIACTAPQLLSPSEQHAPIDQGCLLVDLHNRGTIEVSHQATGTVRFVAAELDLSTCDDWDDAALVMQNQLEQFDSVTDARLSLITWTLTDHSPLSLKLVSGASEHRDDFIATWKHSFAPQGDRILIHDFQAGNRLPQAVSVTQQACTSEELAAALFQVEQSEQADPLERLASAWTDRETSTVLLARLKSDLSPVQIDRQAKAVVSQWMTQCDPENLSHANYSS